MKKLIFFLVACLSVFAVTTTATAKDKPGKLKSSAEMDSSGMTKFTVRDPALQVTWAFSEEERRVVHEYVQSSNDKAGWGRAKPLPPGLAKKVARGEQLPPGWRNRCVVGEIMPPDIYGQCHTLPPAVVVRMPPPPEPTITVTIGGKVVRLLKATREILDVFDVNVRS